MVDPMGLIPDEVRSRFYDAMIDAAASVARRSGSKRTVRTILKLKTDAPFRARLDTAIRRGIGRFRAECVLAPSPLVQEVASHVTAWYQTKEFADLLVGILQRPALATSPEHETLRRKLHAVQPAVGDYPDLIPALLRFIADEIWYLPEFLPTYQLQLQRIATEQSIRMADELHLLRRHVMNQELTGRASPVELESAPDAASSGAGQVDGESRIQAALDLQRRSVLAEFLPGLTDLRLGDLFADDGPRVSPPWARLGARVETGDIMEFLLAEAVRGAGPAYFVLGGAGAGKTTVCRLLFCQLASLYDGSVVSRPPLLFDLREFLQLRNDPVFGSASWLERNVTAVYGIDFADCILIVDGLDEFLAGLSPAELSSICSRPLIAGALVVGCRTNFYDRWLAMARIGAVREELELLPWSSQLQKAYIRKATEFRDGGAAGLSTAMNWLTSTAVHREMCSSPLRLSMAVELAAADLESLDDVDDTLGLYDASVDRVLSREATNGASVIDADTKLSWLERIAWIFHDEEGVQFGEAARFARREFLRVFELDPSLDLATRSRVREDIEFRSLLRSDVSTLADGKNGSISFEHRSFQNYFVARHLYHVIRQGDRSEIADGFARFIEADVSDFLIAMIRREISHGRTLRDIALAIGATLDLSIDNDRDGRGRLRRAQLAYYLGATAQPEAKEILRRHFSSEPDPWLQRAIAIGLSLAGDQTALNIHVELMRAERGAGGRAPRCVSNLGYHLSFFGDQPLDPLNPDVDRGLERCSRTVESAIAQLQRESKRGSWRSALFTLVDLGTNRAESIAEYRGVVRKHEGELRAVLTRFSKQPHSSDWPEIGEMLTILESLS